jgi:hypothetical protein
MPEEAISSGKDEQQDVLFAHGVVHSGSPRHPVRNQQELETAYDHREYHDDTSFLPHEHVKNTGVDSILSLTIVSFKLFFENLKKM